MPAPSAARVPAIAAIFGTVSVTSFIVASLSALGAIGKLSERSLFTSNLQQPVDRKNGQDADLRALKPRRSRLGRVASLTRGTTIDPLEALSVGHQPYLVRDHGHGRVEVVRELLCERRAVDHEAHLGV